MEKFYIAEEGSRLREDYLKHLESKENIKNLAMEFFKANGITANEFYADNDYLHIVATDEDKEKFDKQLCKPDNGLYRFRANSKINKLWVKTLEQHNVKVIFKPSVPLYFKRYGGRFSSRLFEIDGVIYCSFSSGWDFKPKDKLTEIKASEFFRVIEDYNEQIKENE